MSIEAAGDRSLYWRVQLGRNHGARGLFAVVVLFLVLYAYLFPGLLTVEGFSKFSQTWFPLALTAMAQALLQQADTLHGGFGNAPKFPGTMAIAFLLEHYHYTGDEQALKQAQLSLDAMINGGIYDQLGGGFARPKDGRGRAPWIA